MTRCKRWHNFRLTELWAYIEFVGINVILPISPLFPAKQCWYKGSMLIYTLLVIHTVETQCNGIWYYKMPDNNTLFSPVPIKSVCFVSYFHWLLNKIPGIKSNFCGSQGPHYTECNCTSNKKINLKISFAKHSTFSELFDVKESQFSFTNAFCNWVKCLTHQNIWFFLNIIYFELLHIYIILHLHGTNK